MQNYMVQIKLKKELYIFINDILDKIESIEGKEKKFLQLFLKKYSFNKFFQVIPQVSTRNFNLAMFFLSQLKPTTY